MKRLVLRKWLCYVLIIINTIILATISNNEISLDLLLGIVFILNSMLLLRKGNLERFTIGLDFED